MTEAERRIKRKIQFVVASAISFLSCLVFVLGVLFSIRGNQRAMETGLRNTKEQLQTQIDFVDSEISYFLTAEFIEQYLLKELGYGKNGAQIFQK